MNYTPYYVILPIRGFISYMPMSKAEHLLAGYTIETPLVSAAGALNSADPEVILKRVSSLANTAIGAITLGSITIPPQAGNQDKFGSPVYYFDSQTNTTFNAMGLPNIGLVKAVQLWPEILHYAHDHSKVVIASVSPTIETPHLGTSANQLVRLVEAMLETGVDLIEVNTGSPNLVTADGGRKPQLAYDLNLMRELLDLFKSQLGFHSNIGIKLPPYVTPEQQNLAAQIAVLFKEILFFKFLVTANSIPNQIPTNHLGQPILTVPRGLSGMSGPSTKLIGREQLQLWRQLMGEKVQIVSTLGVDSGEEMAIRLQLGAAAVGGVTFLIESDNWERAIGQVITDWTKTENLSQI